MAFTGGWLTETSPLVSRQGPQVGAVQVNVAAQSVESTQLILQPLLPSQANGVQSVITGTH